MWYTIFLAVPMLQSEWSASPLTNIDKELYQIYGQNRNYIMGIDFFKIPNKKVLVIWKQETAQDPSSWFVTFRG